MRIIVQKFGGTSVIDEKSRLRCVEHIKSALAEGFDHVAVVVSAMGRRGDPYATDTLLSLLKPAPVLSKRNRDIFLATGELISASVFANLLSENGIANTILTGGQAGILTNDAFGEAKIISLQPKRVLEEFSKGNVVVVAGFQGVTPDGEITTLGRGGSDTSAAALGVALQAEVVDIFTDVDGIYTADPRIVEDARAISEITYNEICNLAHLGAKVIHPRAVEIAMQKNIPLRVRSTFTDNTGTLVGNFAEIERSSADINDRLVTGITQTPMVTQIQVASGGRPSQTLHLDIFKAMKDNHISVDFINAHPGGAEYTVAQSDAAKASDILTQLCFSFQTVPECAKVSVVGANMAGVPGVMAQIIEALTDENIDVLQSADSHTTIWVLVKNKDMIKAIRSLHKKFGLHASAPAQTFARAPR